MTQLTLLETNTDSPPIDLREAYLSRGQADWLYNYCQSLDWQQYGASLNLPKRDQHLAENPRLECIYARSPMVYEYADITLESKPLPLSLLRLMDKLEQDTGHPYEFVIGNQYRHGQDSIGWHADRDAGMGDWANAAIVSISLGAQRKFQMRRTGAGTEIHDFWLPHGSLLLMRPGCQADWLHQLPKDHKIQHPRINLTFRPWPSIRKISAPPNTPPNATVKVPSLSPDGKTHHELVKDLQAQKAIASNGKLAGYVLRWDDTHLAGVSVRGRFHRWDDSWHIISEGDLHAV